MGSLFCLRLFILPLGSSLFAAHAYHKPPTSVILVVPRGLSSRSMHLLSLLTKSTSSVQHIPTTNTAVLRDISAGTSYQIVRWVFRPYIHLLPTSWTSVRLRSSTRISPCFNHGRYSSLSFGSYHCDYLSYRGYCFTCIHLAAVVDSLVRITIRVRTLLGLLHYAFTISLSKGNFFNFRSPYSSAIGLRLYLALGDTTSCLHTALSSSTTPTPCELFQDYNLLWFHIPEDSFFPLYNDCIVLPSELFLVRSPLLKESMFLYFPTLNDMLKSRVYSCTYVHN